MSPIYIQPGLELAPSTGYSWCWQCTAVTQERVKLAPDAISKYWERSCSELCGARQTEPGLCWHVTLITNGSRRSGGGELSRTISCLGQNKRLLVVCVVWPTWGEASRGGADVTHLQTCHSFSSLQYNTSTAAAAASVSLPLSAAISFPYVKFMSLGVPFIFFCVEYFWRCLCFVCSWCLRGASCPLQQQQ